MIKDISRSALNLLMGLILAGFVFTPKASAADGKAIFKQNCAVCHSMTDQHLTGPGLAGVMDRVPPGKWLHDWIKNSEKMIKSGDQYATKILKENGGATMTVFEGTLTDADIDEVIAYLKKGDATTTTSSTTTGGTTGEQVVEAKGGIDPLYIILIIIVILAILIGILRGVRNSMSAVAEHTPDEELAKTFWQESRDWMASHRRFIGVCCIIIVLLGMRSCWNSLWMVGVYYDDASDKGYKPEQPIKFSHKLHAGDNGIACQYCHNSVEKSRHAGIPTVNVCMNCHKSIQTGPQYADKEISKIYAAAGFDAKTGTYDLSKQNPIQWIKVHNLPDHVYFNHSQHVVVGKQECATCHGNVKEMTVAEQKSPLTMGWCIDCHRKTDVAMEGNAYYDKLHAYLKNKYKDQHLKTFTVAQMGGLECAKCHY
ncbi:MAG: cytochrome [Bacteroidetes bacterium]|jgi:mono/diheme cytochrome c family protein|nr:cytochrome [Bacteroidota bacterium]